MNIKYLFLMLFTLYADEGRTTPDLFRQDSQENDADASSAKRPALVRDTTLEQRLADSKLGLFYSGDRRLSARNPEGQSLLDDPCIVSLLQNGKKASFKNIIVEELPGKGLTSQQKQVLTRRTDLLNRIEQLGTFDKSDIGIIADVVNGTRTLQNALKETAFTQLKKYPFAYKDVQKECELSRDSKRKKPAELQNKDDSKIAAAASFVRESEDVIADYIRAYNAPLSRKARQETIDTDVKLLKQFDNNTDIQKQTVGLFLGKIDLRAYRLFVKGKITDTQYKEVATRHRSKSKTRYTRIQERKSKLPEQEPE